MFAEEKDAYSQNEGIYCIMLSSLGWYAGLKKDEKTVIKLKDEI